MKRIFSVLLIFILVLGLCSCDRFEDTPETDAAFAAYEEAIKRIIACKSGTVSVQTVNKDTLENTESVGVIEYSYITDENSRVSFDRKDYTNGELVASYYGDGTAAYQMDLTTDEWIDVTETSGDMLEHDKNYMNTLSLFRIDSDFRYSKQYYESVVLEEVEEGGRVITFTIKSSVISDMFSYTDDREMKREMTHQYRSYYVDASGELYKIVIDSSQNVSLSGKEGVLSNVITVLVDFK